MTASANITVIGYCATPGSFQLTSSGRKPLEVSKELTGYEVAHVVAAWVNGEQAPDTAPEELPPDVVPVDDEGPKVAKGKSK